MKLSELIEKLNYQLPIEYWFILDPIYSIDNEQGNIFLGRAESILNDMHVFPWNLLHFKLDRFKECKKILWWINEKIFTYELTLLCEEKKVDTITAFVRIRIVQNMIRKLDILTEEEKEEWANLIKIVFYERLRVMINYYLTFIEKLPF